ncbi:hypothetical protein N7539_002678 [Penicillium diatomitis]|uniref:Uncharacterized protein n=1 Tax=Penicillium diatomitis TaxID=2819901 RepID=A0A9X0BYX5_9EURO|nr:uncharacterized protein N7539_002678 [Penicillium diatomitis]KAJ5491111.1 hypothetical protein N7539_002678 [Penicillium diatomitis]
MPAWANGEGRVPMASFSAQHHAKVGNEIIARCRLPAASYLARWAHAKVDIKSVARTPPRDGSAAVHGHKSSSLEADAFLLCRESERGVGSNP